MSQEKVELVRRLLDMFANRENEAVFAFYDPDIEWDARAAADFGAGDDLSGVYRGHEGVRNYWRRWLQAWKDIQFEVDDVLDGWLGGLPPASGLAYLRLPDLGYLAARLVWDRQQGYRTAKARQASGYVDRPLLPSEQTRLVEEATRLARGERNQPRGPQPTVCG